MRHTTSAEARSGASTGQRTTTTFVVSVREPASTFRKRRQRSIHDAPEVRIEETPIVRIIDFVQAAIYRDTGIIDPRVDAPELRDGGFRDALDILAQGDVAGGGDGHSARDFNRAHDALQSLRAARSEHESGALVGCRLRRGKTDSARGARDNDDLLIQWLERRLHFNNSCFASDRECRGFRGPPV